MFEFKDTKISDNSFSRYILDTKFTFKDNKLISTEVFTSGSYITIYSVNQSNLLNSTALLLKHKII